MFDPKKIMDERTLQDIIPTPIPALFPNDEYIPEGAHVLTGLRDWGHKVGVHADVVYVERDITGPDGQPAKMPLHLQILEPRLHTSATAEEKAKPIKWPCVIHVQGSAFMKQFIWSNLVRHIRLAQKGYVIVIVEYRHSAVAPFPAQMEDAKTAIRYVRKHAAEYNIDANRIALSGDSSGGHTALMVGFTGDEGPDTDVYKDEFSASVNCIIDVYGPTVFSLMNYFPSSQNHYDPDSPEGLEIGAKNVLEHPELVKDSIPMNWLSKDKPTPPLLIMHGSRDMLVPYSQSVMLYEYMRDMGKDVTFYRLEGANHGCLGFDSDTVIDIMAGFLEKYNR